MRHSHNRFSRTKMGYKIICHSTQKQNKSIKKNKQIVSEKDQSKKKQKSIKEKKGSNKMEAKHNLIPEMQNLAFQFDVKNQCQKMIDSLLSQNLEQISQCNYIKQPFIQIKLTDDMKSKTDGDSKEFQVYLHQVCNTKNPLYTFGFISSARIPELKELELQIRKDPEDYKSEVNACLYHVKFISTLRLSYSQLLSIYNFNVGFFKDFQQEGNQVSSFIFEYFIQSQNSVKFLQVLLNQNQAEVELQKYKNESMDENFVNKIQEMENEFQDKKADESIDFQLIETFNIQKAQKSETSNLSLTNIFNKFSQQLQMVDEISISEEQKSNMGQQTKMELDSIQDLIDEKTLQNNALIQESQQSDKFLELDNQGQEKLDDQITQNFNQVEQISMLEDVHQNLDGQEENIKNEKKTDESIKSNQEAAEQNKQSECQVKGNDQKSENLTKQQDPNSKDQQQKQRIRLDGDEFQESDKLKNIKSTIESKKFKQMYKSYVFRHLFLCQDLYQIIEIFDPSNTTIDSFIQALSNHIGLSYDSIKQKLGFLADITIENLKNGTLYDCIYSQADKYLTDKAQIFFALRKQFVSSQSKNIQLQIHEQQQQLAVNSNSTQSNQTSQNKYYHNTSSASQYHLFNRRNPLVLCKKINHLKNFDFISELHIKNNKGVFQSCLQKDFTENKINVSLFPLEHFQQHVLNSNLINSHLQAPSIFSLIKDVMIVRDFACNYFLENNVGLELLIESFSLMSYSKTKNLELLEVIGDVVIKYISSLYLYLHLPNQSENALTMIRTIFINNKYLGIQSFRNGLQFYVQTRKPNSYDWRFNLFNLNSFTEAPQDQKQQFQLTYSNLSDVLESVVGCFYASNNFTLNVCIQLIKDLGLQIDKNLLSRCQNQVNGSFVLSDELLDMIKIEEDMSYYELYLQGKKLLFKDKLQEYEKQTDQTIQYYFEQKMQSESIKSEENTQFVWNLMKYYIKNELIYKNKYEVEYENNTCPNQRRRDRSEYKKYKLLHEQTLDIAITGFEKMINYTFKDKSLLVKALNCYSNSNFENYSQDYQILEFLGDALIEILVVSHGYHISRNKQKKINSPYFFCEMKSLLLSNDFISRMAILNKFHYYALNISKYQQDEIVQFIEDCNLKTKFKESVSHQANSPKVLGDLWESVAGAIIMDSDISTFVSVYGRLYAPYISHFVTFYEKIIFNVKEKVQLVAQQTYEEMGKITEVIQDTDKQYKIKVGTGIDVSETLAEKKAFQDAYDNIFIKQQSNLGLTFQGKQV